MATNYSLTSSFVKAGDGLETVSNNPVGMQMSQPTSTPSAQQSTANSSNKLYCDVCDVYMSGDIVMKAHLSGKRHNLNVQHRAKGENIVKGLAKKNRSGKGENKLDIPYVEGECHLEKALTSVQDITVGLMYITEYHRFKGSDTDLRYACSMCNSKCDGAVTMLTHLKGIKHKLAVAKAYYPDSYQHLNEHNVHTKVQVGDDVRYTTDPQILQQINEGAKQIEILYGRGNVNVQTLKVGEEVALGLQKWSTKPKLPPATPSSVKRVGIGMYGKRMAPPPSRGGYNGWQGMQSGYKQQRQLQQQFQYNPMMPEPGELSAWDDSATEALSRVYTEVVACDLAVTNEDEAMMARTIKKSVDSALRQYNPQAFAQMCHFSGKGDDIFDDGGHPESEPLFPPPASNGDGQAAIGDGQAAIGDGQAASGDGQAASGDGQAASGDGQACDTKPPSLLDSMWLPPSQVVTRHVQMAQPGVMGPPPESMGGGGVEEIEDMGPPPIGMMGMMQRRRANMMSMQHMMGMGPRAVARMRMQQPMGRPMGMMGGMRGPPPGGMMRPRMPPAMAARYRLAMIRRARYAAMMDNYGGGEDEGMDMDNFWC